MRVLLQLLVPGVEYAEEPDVGAESLWIASDFDEGFCTGPEQKVVNDLLVLQCQWSEFMRQREDDMRIRHRQQIA